MAYQGTGQFWRVPTAVQPVTNISLVCVAASSIVAAVHIVACYFGEWQYVEFLASAFSSGTPESRWVSNYIVKMDGPGMIEAGTTGSWNNVPMVIPPIVPSRLAGCGIINVNYVLKVGHSFIPFSTRPLVSRGEFGQFLKYSNYRVCLILLLLLGPRVARCVEAANVKTARHLFCVDLVLKGCSC